MSHLPERRRRPDECHPLWEVLPVVENDPKGKGFVGACFICAFMKSLALVLVFTMRQACDEEFWPKAAATLAEISLRDAVLP